MVLYLRLAEPEHPRIISDELDAFARVYGRGAERTRFDAHVGGGWSIGLVVVDIKKSLVEY
jgi:hypothetical protein